MKLYTLNKTQILPIGLCECWNFFSNPSNLEQITPPELGLKVKSETADKMYAGMIIEYDVTPLAGIKQTWVTEITQVDYLNYFIDEQRFGPYKFWHHQHKFKKLSDNTTQAIDIVNYSLPLDPVSRIINNLFISKQLNRIFEFRKQVLEKMFGSIPC
ncbi:MAG TPA: SRPBCC family protein [Thermodesulfobacteriota bacterium]|nr:SRPBCC family protein [Thermodesulfobacteriota bacterium]